MKQSEPRQTNHVRLEVNMMFGGNLLRCGELVDADCLPKQLFKKRFAEWIREQKVRVDFFGA